MRLRTPHPVWGDTVVVKDLMEREGYNRPDRVGVGPTHRGIAFGVALSGIEAILDATELPERVTVIDEFVERDGHMVPRNRRLKCARCEKWMTADQSVPRQQCPHCDEVWRLSRAEVAGGSLTWQERSETERHRHPFPQSVVELQSDAVRATTGERSGAGG